MKKTKKLTGAEISERFFMENIHLIWDFSNLKALCQDCHHKQDHQLKVDHYKNYKKITEFIKGCVKLKKR
ncbi:hypothetical protein LCGC14_1474720 [marine sediment metagenome]|uniref:HNH domain-containing protein n=1 Tax=marine sediment metagenome TaxID=412755 RepID=A0A0F9JX87_9ZZZZ